MHFFLTTDILAGVSLRYLVFLWSSITKKYMLGLFFSAILSSFRLPASGPLMPERSSTYSRAFSAYRAIADLQTDRFAHLQLVSYQHVHQQTRTRTHTNTQLSCWYFRTLSKTLRINGKQWLANKALCRACSEPRWSALSSPATSPSRYWWLRTGCYGLTWDLLKVLYVCAGSENSAQSQVWKIQFLRSILFHPSSQYWLHSEWNCSCQNMSYMITCLKVPDKSWNNFIKVK